MLSKVSSCHQMLSQSKPHASPLNISKSSRFLPSSLTQQSLQKLIKKGQSSSHTHCRSNTTIQSKSSLSKAKIQNSSFDSLTEILPEWLIMREDFQKKYKQMKKLEFVDISSIVSIPSASRSDDEKVALYQWMSSIKFFKTLPQAVIRDLCDCLQCVKYKENETSNS